MNKTTLILVIVVIILILGGGGVFLFTRFQNPTQTAPQTAVTQAPTQAQKISTQKKSLKDLLTLSGNQQCTFSDKETGGSGTVFTSGGKVRGDFSSKTSSKTVQSHMLTDGKYLYFWTEGETKGYKMSLDVVQNLSDSAAQQSSQMMDMKKQVDYTCNPAAVDSSKFVVPTNITFTDYTSMMKGVMKGTTNYPSVTTSVQNNQAACNQCNQLPPGAAQTQCRAALHC